MNDAVLLQSPSLQQLLRGLGHEIRVRRAERGAWRGAFWGACAAVAILAAKGWLGDLALPGATLTLGLGALLGAAIGACRGIPPVIAAARLADRAFQLHDRLSTTLELSARADTGPLSRALHEDVAARVAQLQRRGIRVVPRGHASEAQRLVVPLLGALVLAFAPPLPSPEGWLQGLGADRARDERTSVSFLDRVKLLGSELLRRNPFASTADASQRSPDQARAPSESAEFKDRAMAKQRSDFSSFVKKGDERLRMLERTDRLPDLQSDFASSKYRMLLRRSQELSSGKGPGQISAAKLAQILREMERLGRKGGDWGDDVGEGLQALEEGQTDEAMEAMQNALGKIRESEDRQRAGRMLRGGRDINPDDPEGSRADSAGLNDLDRRGGYSSAKGGASKGAASARLRSSPYDTGVQGMRSGRMPSVETQMTSRPGALGMQLQYLAEISQYRKLMEDAIAREQVPRDYHNQIRDYFKSLQEQ